MLTIILVGVLTVPFVMFLVIGLNIDDLALTLTLTALMSSALAFDVGPWVRRKLDQHTLSRT